MQHWDGDHQEMGGLSYMAELDNTSKYPHNVGSTDC